MLSPHRIEGWWARVVGPGVGKARAGMLSVDTTGPLVRGRDVVGGVARFLLVGAFTWILPKDSGMREERIEEKDQEGEEGEAEAEEMVIFEEEEDEEEVEEGQRRKRGRPKKVEPEEERMEGYEELMQKKDQPEAEEEKKDEDHEDQPPDDFEVKVFRMMIPMETKTGEEVLRCVAEMVTRLHLQIHSDHGGEFTGRMLQKWVMNRGIARTFTGVSDPQSNGRVENSVQQVKSYLRRVLLQARLPSTSWPLAATQSFLEDQFFFEADRWFMAESLHGCFTHVVIVPLSRLLEQNLPPLL